MLKRTLRVTGLVLLLIAAATVVSADVVTLKNGQVHKGEIIAEEDGRLQIKLDNSGVRLWFPSDQIASREKASPAEAEGKEKNKVAKPSVDAPIGLDNDAAKAREMLDKIRQEQESSPPEFKNSTRRSKAKGSSKNQGAKKVKKKAHKPVDVPALIQTLRKGKSVVKGKPLYKVRNACIAIGKNGVDEAIPDLIQCLDHKSQLIQDAANDALKKITEEDFGFQSGHPRNVRLDAIKRWKDWHKNINKEEATKQLKSLF